MSLQRFTVDGYRENFAPGFVYLLQAGPYFKIGRAKNVERRLSAIRLQLPFPVGLVGWGWSDRYVDEERRYHRRFADKRRNGEWFVLDDDEVGLLLALFDADTHTTIEEWLGLPVQYVEVTA